VLIMDLMGEHSQPIDMMVIITIPFMVNLYMILKSMFMMIIGIIYFALIILQLHWVILWFVYVSQVIMVIPTAQPAFHIAQVDKYQTISEAAHVLVVYMIYMEIAFQLVQLIQPQ